MLKSRIIEGESVVCHYTSTDILKSKYDPLTQDMVVHFHNGGVYGYKPVNSYMHHSFSTAKSQGKALFEKIKGNPRVNVRKIR
jgi:hypothetical protein